MALIAGLVSAATSAAAGAWLAVRPIAETAFSSEKNEAPADFSPDGRAFYFTRSERDFSAPAILVSEFRDGQWSPPVTAPFASSQGDAAGSFSLDGAHFFFTSRRPVPSSTPADTWNLWVVRNGPAGWSEAELLPAPVNTDSAECCVRVSAGGTLYFASDRQGSWDIYRAAPQGGQYEVTRLGAAVNSAFDEWPSYVDPEERFLLFSSIRPTGFGGGDVYLAERDQSDWQPARLLGYPVNSPAYEDSAILGPGQAYLLYASSKGRGGSADIFQVPGGVFESLVRESRTRSRMALLWENAAMNPESAIALASLGNAYAEAGETELARQSFQLALDQLSADPDLKGEARERFRQSVGKRMQLLRVPAVRVAGTKMPSGTANARANPRAD